MHTRTNVPLQAMRLVNKTRKYAKEVSLPLIPMVKCCWWITGRQMLEGKSEGNITATVTQTPGSCNERLIWAIGIDKGDRARGHRKTQQLWLRTVMLTEGGCLHR